MKILKLLVKLLEPYSGMRREIYIIAISKTVNAMGALIGPFMTLLLSQKIGLSSGETGIYVAIVGLLHIPSSLLGGKLSDTFGRKKVLVGFEILAALGYISCYFIEPSMNMVYVLMFSSVCFGIAGPSHDAMTADLTKPEQRQGAFSLNYLGFNFGFAIAQVFAGLLFENHFKILFIMDAATALLGLLLISIFVGETLGLVQKDSGKIERQKETQIVKESIFRVLRTRPILLYFALASFGYKFVYSQWSFMIPLHAVANFGTDGYPLYGWLGTLNAAIVVICTPIITFLFHKNTHIRRIVYAGILFTIGFGMLGFISTQAAFFISVITFTIGEILEAISTTPYIMSHTPASHRGRIGSIISLMMGAGYTLGTMIMGNVLEFTSFETCWMISGSVVLIATICMKVLEAFDRRHSEQLEKENNQIQEQEEMSCVEIDA